MLRWLAANIKNILILYVDVLCYYSNEHSLRPECIVPLVGTGAFLFPVTFWEYQKLLNWLFKQWWHIKFLDPHDLQITLLTIILQAASSKPTFWFYLFLSNPLKIIASKSIKVLCILCRESELWLLAYSPRCLLFLNHFSIS